MKKDITGSNDVLVVKRYKGFWNGRASFPPLRVNDKTSKLFSAVAFFLRLDWYLSKDSCRFHFPLHCQFSKQDLSIVHEMRALLATLYVQALLYLFVGAHTFNYDTVAAAAKKKNVELEVGKTYLLLEATRTIFEHHKIIIGTVIEDCDGQRDFPAVMTQLTLDNKEVSGIRLDRFCQVIGKPCKTLPDDSYTCSERSKKGQPRKYRFKGEAEPEFADPQTFIALGMLSVIVCKVAEIDRHSKAIL